MKFAQLKCSSNGLFRVITSPPGNRRADSLKKRSRNSP
jgi:hypothetical protein